MRRLFMLIFGVLAALILLLGLWAYTPDMSRAELETKYFVPSDVWIDTAGIRLHVSDTGPKTAPVLVLLHGFGSSLQTWDLWADVLSLKYRVIRYDLPGSALTGADPTNDYSETRAVAVLVALLDQLDVAKATIIGNSMGGKLAWEFAAQFPARVDKLVLISPDGLASPGFDYGKKADVPALLGLARYFLPKQFVRMSMAPAYADPASLRDETVTRYWELMRAPGVRGAMFERLRQTILIDPESALCKIDAPTLLLWGEKDGMIPLSNAQDYLRVLKTATFVPLPNLGHVPQEESPDRSLSSIESFISGTD